MQKIRTTGTAALLLLSSLSFSCKDKPNNTPVYPTNCANYLVGTYAGNDFCSSGQTPYTCNVIANTPEMITFSNLGGVSVTAVLNCSDNTLKIPMQTFPGNFSITGSGNFTANRIIINWNGTLPGSQINCNTTYTR